MTPATAQLPRLLRDQHHLFFDPHEKPRLRVPSGARVVVETEDAHLGSIRTERDVYKSLAEVFEKLGGANPVTGPIYVEGVEPGDCVAMTIEDIVPGAVQGQGYTVNIDRVGTAPLDQCVVTNVRNPQQVTQWVPYNGPGRNGDRVLVQVVTSQTISVTLNCSR